MIRRLIVILTRLALIAAFVLAVVWAVTDFDLEPTITSFALLAAILGILIEPWIAKREARSGILRDLIHELSRNGQVLDDPKLEQTDGAIVIYPRVSFAVVEVAVSSGLFSAGGDEKLIKELHGWHELAGEFNNRVSVTEQFTLASSLEDRITWQQKLKTGRTLNSIRERLQALVQHILDNYSTESGISKDTEIFSDNGSGR